MRHRKQKYRLGSGSAHRKSLLKNLAVEIIDHGEIRTTHAKGKAVRPVVEKLITLAKTDNATQRRLAFKKLNHKKAVKKLFEEVAPQFHERPGGYTRISKFADGRLGDGAPMCLVSLVK